MVRRTLAAYDAMLACPEVIINQGGRPYMYALYVCLLCIPCPEVIINHGGRPFCAHAYHTLCALSQPFARARALPTFPVPRPCVPSPPPCVPPPNTSG